LRINEAIRVSPIRLIDDENNQMGIIDTKEGVAMARQKSLDLVEVSPNAEPPVCRIMDFGKWLYDQKRKNKQSHKKQHAVVLKEIRLRPKTDTHDLEIKVNHAIKFIEKGHKVQFTMLFRGREMMFINRGYELMNSILTQMEDCAKLEREAKILSRRMTMVVTAK